MKYIVTFVLLGLAAYAGVFMLYTGIQQNMKFNDSSVALSSITDDDLVEGMAMSAKVDRQFGKMRFTRSARRNFLGFEFGEPVVQHFYLIPAGKISIPQEQCYMLICVTDEEDIKALDDLYSESLSSAGSGTPFEVGGILAEAPPQYVEDAVNYIIWKPRLIKDPDYLDLLGDDALSAPTHINGYNHLCKYIFYVRHEKSGGALPVIIVGAAVTVVSVGLIALTAIKKHRESTGY